MTCQRKSFIDVLVSFPVELEDTDELKHILITSGQYFYHVLDVKKEHITAHAVGAWCKNVLKHTYRVK